MSTSRAHGGRKARRTEATSSNSAIRCWVKSENVRGNSGRKHHLKTTIGDLEEGDVASGVEEGDVASGVSLLHQGKRTGDHSCRTAIRCGDAGILPHNSGPRAVKTKDSSTSLRWLSVNSLGNVFRLGYHSATGTLTWATAALRRDGSGGLGSGTPRVGAAPRVGGQLDGRSRHGSPRRRS